MRWLSRKKSGLFHNKCVAVCSTTQMVRIPHPWLHVTPVLWMICIEAVFFHSVCIRDSANFFRWSAPVFSLQLSMQKKHRWQRRKKRHSLYLIMVETWQTSAFRIFFSPFNDVQIFILLLMFTKKNVVLLIISSRSVSEQFSSRRTGQ